MVSEFELRERHAVENRVRLPHLQWKPSKVFVHHENSFSIRQTSA
jgi:hypothetical protein